MLAAWTDPGQGMAQVGATIVIVIVASALFSFWQEDRVARMLGALRDLRVLAPTARDLADGWSRDGLGELVGRGSGAGAVAP